MTDVDFTTLVAAPGAAKPLGVLAWFNITETRPGRETLKEALNNNGLSEKLLPPPVKPVDVFRRATASVKQKRAKGMKEGTFINVLVTESHCDESVVVRHITHQVVDARNVEVSHPEVARVILHRATGDLNFECSGAVEEICETIQRRYSGWVGTYSSASVRCIIRQVLKEAHSVLFRDAGAVYFAPQEYSDTIDRLAGFVTELGSEMAVIPVVDAASTRDMVAVKIEADVREKMEKLLDELGSAETVKDVIKVSGKINTLREHARVYQRALETEIAAITKNLVKLQNVLDEKLAG